MPKRPENNYPAYHAHVYFDKNTLEQATALCTEAGKAMAVPVGRVHTRNVGPHPHWSCQLSFDSGRFDMVIAWLDKHRNGLNILVHGVTGDNLADHTDHAAWLGKSSKLDLSPFQNS